MAEFRVLYSGPARKHLDDIYRYGYLNWGKPHADKYFFGLEDYISELAGNPYLYPKVDHIKLGYRRAVYKRHAVYYRILEDTIEVMAIIGRQDATGIL